MLALKTVLADLDEIPVLVFDEVDANVGGEIGRVVGEKMVVPGASGFLRHPSPAGSGAREQSFGRDERSIQGPRCCIDYPDT